MDGQPRTSRTAGEPRHGAEILAAWREAERRLAVAAPHDAGAMRAEVTRLRTAYHAWMDATMDEGPGDRAPRPDVERAGSHR
jgi:hypothetical protein